MTIGRTEDPENPKNLSAFEVDALFGTGSRNPSGPAVIAPHEQAGHMIAVDPYVMALTLLNQGGRPHRRFWYDTVCYGSKAALTCACEAFGADKLVTGSDYPVLQDWEDYRETFAYIGEIGLPGDAANRILHHNAQELFGLAH